MTASTTGGIAGQSLQGWLDHQREAQQVVGCSAGIWQGGKLQGAASGLLNLDTGVSATVDSVFQIGSISKIFTTTQIMQQLDAGRLELDAPVRRYLPEFSLADAEAAAAITVRQLLNHSSGMEGDFFPEDGDDGGTAAGYLQKMSLLPQLAPVGRYMTYCNAGWVVLARILEKLSGLRWQQTVQQDVLQPCGLQTAFVEERDALRFRCAIGHLPTDPAQPAELATAEPYLPRSLAAAGSRLSMDVASLLRFARVHLDGGRIDGDQRLLSAASTQAVQENSIPLMSAFRSSVNHWGLGWAIADHPGLKVVGHDGGTLGQFAYLRLLPAHGLAFCLLSNSPSLKLWEAFETAVLAEYAQARYPEPPETETWTVEPERYTGEYRSIAGRIRVVAEGEGLSMQVLPLGPGGGIEECCTLRPLRPDVFAISSGPNQGAELRFLEADGQGRAVYLRQGVRMSRRLP